MMGITGESTLNTIQNIYLLFSDNGDIISDTTKNFSYIFSSKSSGYFLLNFDHPNIPFSQIVVKLDHPRNAT